MGVGAQAAFWPEAPTGCAAAFAGVVGLGFAAAAEIVRAGRMVSSRAAASRIAAHNERLVRTFFEHTPTAVAMLDRDMRYIVHSRAWTREFAMGDNSLVGRLHYEVFPDIPERWREIHRRCLAGAVERSDDDEFVRADGVRYYVRWDCRPWYDGDGSIGGITLMSQDVTAFKRVEFERIEHNQQLLSATRTLKLQARALERAMEDAQAANRAKSEFLANISHEIRTPLTAILGYSQLLKDRALSESDRADSIDRLGSAGSHLASLLDDILDLTKIEAGHMTVESIPTDVPAVLREAIAMVSPRAIEKGLQLNVQIDADAPTWTRADPTRLRQILVNLVCNAVKFTPRGSVIVSLRALRAGMIVIDVTDTGIGIDEADLGRLFQPFSQADSSTTRRFGGTGLGLRISRKLAMLMNGDLAVSSRFNHGSTFTLRIPFVDPVATSQPAAPSVPLAPAFGAPPLNMLAAIGSPTPLAPTAGGPLSGRAVLVVDDSPDNLLLAATHLRRAGASVTCAQCGAAAVGAADAPAGSCDFDLVLLDLHMPETDGYAVLDQMRRVGFAAPIVAFTAHASGAERSRALDAGFDAFITKPFTPLAIIEGCQRVLSAKPARQAAA